MISKTFEELKASGKLPSPTGVGMRILELTESVDFSTEELARTIQADPALAGRILKVANSGERGAMNPARTVSEAIVRVGARVVNNVALGFSLVSANRSGQCEGFPYERFWSQSLAHAVAAQKLCERLRTVTPAEAFLCALMSRVGCLALSSVHPETYSQVLKQAAGRPPEALNELEREHFSIDSWEVSAALLAEWSLPDVYGEAVVAARGFALQEYEGRTPLEKLTAVLHASDELVGALIPDPDAAPDWGRAWQRLEAVRAFMELPEDSFQRLVDELLEGWRSWSASLELSCPEHHTWTRARDEGGGQARTLTVVSDPWHPSEDGDAPRQLSVLLVDADPRQLDRLAQVLSRAGHAVSTATNGRDALRKAMEQGPHIVVAAQHLGDTSGLQLCRALRRFEAGLKVVFLLLCQDQDERFLVGAFESGVDELVLRPLNETLLEARIRGARRIIELQERVEQDKETMRRQLAKLGVLTRRLRAASLTDSLTDLPNRRYAMKRLQQEWAARDRGNELAVVMLDIDHFKRVNDGYGHDTGDEVLRQLAEVLRRTSRKGEEACRLGGEEFLLLLRVDDLDQAVRAGERFRAAVQGNVVKFGNFDGNVTVSVGVAVRTPEMADVDELIKLADQAVYRSKEGGRNRVSSPGPADEAGLRRAG